MTENEAIERLKCMRLCMKISDRDSENKFLEDDYMANKMAISALDEIQQYHSIGTVSEFREAVEKQRVKIVKIIHAWDNGKAYCPNCGIDIHGIGMIEFCPSCGQAISWERDNE